MLNWGIDTANNRRKMGVEITESNMGNNTLKELMPTAAWTVLTDLQRAPLWTHTVNLPDQTGTTIAWQVAAYNTLVPLYFDETSDEKLKVMKWGTILLTEDSGDFEWIITHPSDVQGITYYQAQLALVNQCRVALRAALTALGIGTHLVVSVNANPTLLGQAFALNLGGTTNASWQITIESTTPAITKKALLEGLTQGMNRATITNQMTLLDVEPAIATVISTAAARVVVASVTVSGVVTTNADIDKELITAYLMGDLCHKIATLTTGVGWGGDLGGNYKQWRVLFPKSHPSQLLYQAITGLPTPQIIAAIRAAFLAQRANIITDVLDLFARKLSVRGTVKVLWTNAHYAGGNDPGDVILDAATEGTLPGGGLPALRNALANFLNANHVNFLIDEFNNALNALTDIASPPTEVNVVRSTGFASHSGTNRGFAFEDRGEGPTNFPDLATTYDRIKTIANRY
jgi:hypothetical protein